MNGFGLGRYVLLLVASVSLVACIPEEKTDAGTAPNTAPVISGTPATSVIAGATYSFQPSASDSDGDALTFSATGLPEWSAINAQTGVVSGAPTLANVGTSADIVVSVSDAEATASLPAFRVTVVDGTQPGNSAPTISGTPPATVQVGASYSFTPVASDAEGNSLTFSITNKPSWATFNTSTGQLSGMPTTATTHADITIAVSDGMLSAALATFSITVTAPANGAPSISGTPATTVQTGSSYSFTPTASDPDGDVLTFSITNKPAWAAFSVATGALTGTPTAAQAGTYEDIVISVSDGGATQALPMFTVTVTQAPATGTATLTWDSPTENDDGTALSDLAGYRVYSGASAGSLTRVAQLPAGTTSYSLSQLASGTHYFAVSAYNDNGNESALSSVVNKTIP